MGAESKSGAHSFSFYKLKNNQSNECFARVCAMFLFYSEQTRAFLKRIIFGNFIGQRHFKCCELYRFQVFQTKNFFLYILLVVNVIRSFVNLAGAEINIAFRIITSVNAGNICAD